MTQQWKTEDIDPRTPAGADRLRAESTRLADLVARAAAPEGGFGYLGDDSRRDPQEPVATWITARMTHVAGLAALHGQDGMADLVDVGVRGLRGPLHDDVNGGWFPTTRDHEVKEAYAHAFVVLAAATATAAGHPDGAALLQEALATVDQHFWDEEQGLVVDQFDTAFTRADPYRGVNANMHTVEAFLAAYQVTGDRLWLDRAARITERVVHHFARENDWRMPEHFDEQWNADLEYSADNPGDQFRPYGVTIGHLLEWARLALHVRTALGDQAPAWLLEDAAAMYRAGVERGWDVDGAPGFIYTTDWQDRPVVRERMHWVAAEAIATAWSLFAATGDRHYLDDYARWWSYVDAHLLDHADGSWRHELDAHNAPSATVWPGRPDIYHAYQATILPLLPDEPSFVGAARGGW